MYEKFFNLEAEPFELMPDGRFCFDHQSYTKARIYLSYASQFAEGHVMVTGPQGAGKTTLIHQLVKSIPAEKVKIVNLDCSRLADTEILQSVADGLRLEYGGGDRAGFLQQLDVTLQHWRHQNTRALLILDEAETLTAAAFAQLSSLTGLQERGVPLLQIFFVGQPELQELMSKPSMAQLHEHIIAHINLEPLKETEVEPYVAYRLDSVGWNKDPSLSPGIYPLIYQFSGGLPSSINLVCSRLLAQACTEDRHSIGVEDMRKAILELQSEGFSGEATLSATDAQPFNENESQSTFPDAGSGASVEDSSKPGEETALRGVNARQQDADGAYDLEAGSVLATQAPAKPRKPRKSHRSTTTMKREPERRRGKSVVYLALLALVLLLSLGWARDFAGIREMVATRIWLPEASDSVPANSNNSRLVQAADPAAEIADNSINKLDSLPEPVASAVPATETELMTGSASAPELGDASAALETQVPSTDPMAMADGLSEVENGLNCGAKFQVRYDSNSAQLSQEAQGLLNDLARQCLDSSLTKVRVTGYTDTSGDWDYNLQLSQRRAQQVAQYLIAQGVSPESIFAEGLGEYGFDQPGSAPETTRAEDRRIVLLEIQPHMGPP